MDRRSFLSSLVVLLGAACAPSGGGSPTATAPAQQSGQTAPAAAGSPTAAAAQKPESAAKPANSPAPAAPGVSNVKSWQSPPSMAIDPNKTYTASIDTSAGKLTAQLFVKDAPNAVNNFVFLAREGFYTGVPFHRIISNFMVQTGDPTGTGRGGPGYRFNDELPKERDYDRGTLAMANSGPNTQGSQFFICHQDLKGGRLPKNYTIFGKVTEGLDTLDKIAGTPVRAAAPGGEQSVPTQDVRITAVTISEG